MKQYQTDFLNTIKQMIIADMRRTGILASLTAVQAIFESGWGRSELATKANNLFGMKGNYKGESYTVPTKEWVNGQYITINATFRKYPSWQESIDDHSEKFLTMQRYANLRGCTDYKLACRYVYEDGYATAPVYTQKLIRAIEQYDLSSWDAEAAQGTKTEATEPMKKSALATLSFDFGTKKSNVRTRKVTKITPHIMAMTTTDPVGVAKAHYNSTAPVSANYYIAGGKICAGVPEDRRAWTSSSADNDQQAITVETANCGGSPDWKVSDQDYQATVRLYADVCKRYGIIPHYDGTKNGTITVHRMFANKACPGAYMMRLIESGQFERDILAAMGAQQDAAGTHQTPGRAMYRVQVGAFRREGYAEEYASLMRAIGEKALVVRAGSWYKVQVGAYANKAYAEAHADKLKAAGYKAVVIAN